MAAKLPKKAKKLIEEAAEVSLDAVLGNQKGLINESVDVLYHLIVLWRSCDVTPDLVWAEMNRRANNLGVSEKLPKKPNKGDVQKLA
ncbi:phosphoribosyl-ATP diphosphatase [Magnetospirillum fulvum]